MIQNSWNTTEDRLSMFEWEVAESMSPSKPPKNSRKAASKVLPDASSPFYTPRLTVDDMASGFSPDPGQCVLWKQQQFRPRVWLAVAHWCGQPPNVLRSNTQLGSLVPQWGIGAQNQLVVETQASSKYFTPFASQQWPHQTFFLLRIQPSRNGKRLSGHSRIPGLLAGVPREMSALGWPKLDVSCCLRLSVWSNTERTRQSEQIVRDIS